MMNEFRVQAGHMMAILDNMRKHIAKNAEEASEAWETAYDLVRVAEMDDSPTEEAEKAYKRNDECADNYTTARNNLRRIHTMISLMEDIISESDEIEGV